MINKLKYFTIKQNIFWAAPILFLTSETGCRWTRPSSEVKHEWGHTRVEAGTMSSCQGTYQIDPKLTEESFYLKAIGEKIMEKNPVTFAGKYHPRVFCFNVVPTPPGKKQIVQATAHTGLIEFSADMFDHATSEAFLAALLSHELAHITMAHSSRVSHPLVMSDSMGAKALAAWDQKETLFVDWAKSKGDLYHQHWNAAYDFAKAKQEMAFLLGNRTKFTALEYLDVVYPQKDDAYQAYRITSLNMAVDPFLTYQPRAEIKSEWERHQNILRPDYLAATAAHQERLTAKSQLDAAVTRLVPDWKERLNWQEQQADEVGYELFLRAEYQHQAWQEGDRFIMTTSKQDLTYDECVSLYISPPIAGEPDRGREIHPTHCWRLWNLLKKEATHHAPQLADLKKKAVKTAYFPEKWAAIRKKRGACP